MEGVLLNAEAATRRESKGVTGEVILDWSEVCVYTGLFDKVFLVLI